MKKLLLSFALVILGCSFPVQLTVGTPTETPVPVQTTTPTQTPPATAAPGSEQNPLILALSPSPRASQTMIDAGTALAAQIESLTGYHIVTVAPTSEAELVDSFSKGNAHIGVLSPFAYLLAYENGDVTVALASMRDGEILYGSQLIANRESGFKSYFDEARGENTEEAEIALLQFKDKKPCWSDTGSPSGYVVPLGFLNQASVPIGSGAFLEGQPSVVRAVYATGICDFGATFIDARTLPALESDYKDVLERVVVIWRIPQVIPYENVSFASSLPIEMRRVLLRALVDVMVTTEGKAAFQTIYGVEALQPAEDSLYASFSEYVKASQLNLVDLLDLR